MWREHGHEKQNSNGKEFKPRSSKNVVETDSKSSKKYQLRDDAPSGTDWVEGMDDNRVVHPSLGNDPQQENSGSSHHHPLCP